MSSNYDRTSFILLGDFDEPGDEPEKDSYRDRLFLLLMEILQRIERLEKNTHRHKFQDQEYQQYIKLKEKFEK
jgi:hypothetical protein